MRMFMSCLRRADVNLGMRLLLEEACDGRADLGCLSDYKTPASESQLGQTRAMEELLSLGGAHDGNRHNSGIGYALTFHMSKNWLV